MKNSIVLSTIIFFIFINLCNSQKNEENPLFIINHIHEDGNRKYGFMNQNGKVVIEPTFDRVYDFQKDLAKVHIDNKKGLINKKGEFLIIGEYQYLYYYDDEDLIHFEKDGKTGFMNKKGEIVIPARKVIIDGFQDGLFKIRVINKHSYKHTYLNMKGDTIIKPTHNYLSSFYENIAFLGRYKNYRLINRKGKIINKLVFEDHKVFSEGLAPVRLNGKWGYINSKGKIIIEPQFDIAYEFKDGLAVARRDNEKYGYINKKGKFVIKPKFDLAYGFNEALASVKIKYNYGYIDKKGNIVIPVKFGDADKFVNGFARVRKNNQHWAMINTKGEYIYNPVNFLTISNFKNNLALVIYGKSYGYIDKKGNFVYVYGDKNDLKIIEKK